MDNRAAFQSEGGKRRLLVVEDEAINRAILGEILAKDYEVLFAEDGERALALVRENRDVLSLVILDLIMPGLPGLEALCRIRAEDAYQDIPVIVASGDRSQEIECLNGGASDFIQKPYPEPGVILARVRRAIELFEGRRILQSTERDPLTGLYNREFFYSYAEQFDLHHPGVEMDAIILETRCIRRSCTPCSSSRAFPPPSSKGSSRCTSSRSSTSGPKCRCWAARRRWCAGNTRSWAWSAPACSSRCSRTTA